jgi:hypothetical protein
MVTAPPSPPFLLQHPELVGPVAPWCSWLENHELGILLLAQPWLAGQGLRRSELQEQLERLAADLPLGPVYFQRVSRAAGVLEERGQLRAQGSGRQRRYQTTAEGFAALILNLQVLRADPTLDGSEFELKRALVALWNLVAQRMAGAADAVESSAEMGALLEALGRLRVWDQPVITEQVLFDGLDILRLIRTQRERLDGLEAEARQRLEAAAAPHRLMGPAPKPGRGGRREPASPVLMEALAMVRVVASGLAPRLAGEAALLRYRAYREYLDGLTKLYAKEFRFRVVDPAAARRAFKARSAAEGRA